MRGRTIIVVVVLVLSCFFGAGFLYRMGIEQARHLVYKSGNFRWSGLPVNALRVAILSDLHVGKDPVSLSRLSEIVVRVNDWKPDMVLLLGDYADASFRPAPPALINDMAGVLGALRTSGKVLLPVSTPAKNWFANDQMVVAVLGNHDWWSGGERVRTSFEKQGIHTLENQWLQIEMDGIPIYLAGLADTQTRQPDVQKTMEGIPADAAILVLMHNPSSFADLPAQRHLFAFAGHTHAGQMVLPGLGAPWLSIFAPGAWRYGFISERGNFMYVTSGVGVSLLPIRVGTIAEVVFATISGAE